LTSKLWDKIKIHPFYTSEDLGKTAVEYKFHPDSKIPGMSPRIWNNLVSIIPENEKSANEKILDFLQNGADGLVLHLEGKENLNQILKGVHTEFISTNFLPTGETAHLFRAIQDWIESSTLKPSMLKGAILWSPCDELFSIGENFES